MFYFSEKLLKQKIIENAHEQNIKIQYNENIKGEYRIRESKVRINQDYFRTIVLSNYANACGVTGISIPELLIASHIKPWAKDEKNRLNPSNGICLSATFDKAFDRGLITVSPGYSIIYSSRIKKYSKELFYNKHLELYENKQLILPIKFLPNIEFLQYHNETVFVP